MGKTKNTKITLRLEHSWVLRQRTFLMGFESVVIEKHKENKIQILDYLEISFSYVAFSGFLRDLICHTNNLRDKSFDRNNSPIEYEIGFATIGEFRQCSAHYIDRLSEFLNKIYLLIKKL